MKEAAYVIFSAWDCGEAEARACLLWGFFLWSAAMLAIGMMLGGSGMRGIGYRRGKCDGIAEMAPLLRAANRKEPGL